MSFLSKARTIRASSRSGVWRILLTAAALLPSLVSVPQAANAVQPEGQFPPRPRTTCDISGWSVDPDPAGQNVRAGPSIQARVVGRLAPYAPPRGMRTPYGSRFSIIAARNGWFYIDTVSNPYNRQGRVDYTNSPLRGWISSRYIRLRIISEVGFTEPSARSRTLWAGDVQPSFERLLDCRGEWARVSIEEGEHSRQPWFRGICGYPDFCEGVLGDRRR